MILQDGIVIDLFSSSEYGQQVLHKAGGVIGTTYHSDTYALSNLSTWVWLSL